MNPILLIPARMASTRLPASRWPISAGVPMIVRVWRQADGGGAGAGGGGGRRSRRSWQAVEAAGGRAVLTDPGLPSGSDRIYAALETAGPRRAP